MSSVTRRFRVIDGKYTEVTNESPRVAAGSSVMPYGGIQAISESRPLISQSMGVSCPTPERVKEVNDFCRARNIRGVECQPDGSLRITSREGRRDYMRATRRFDQDAGYGDL